jgi:hypothetical protein
MSALRVVRQFGSGITPSTAKAYRLESVELLTESEAFKLMAALGSPYIGRKYEPEVKPNIVRVGAEVKTRSGVFPSIPYVKQADGSWKPKYEYEESK